MHAPSDGKGDPVAIRQEETRRPVHGTPRLVQDFVTAPRPLHTVLDVVAGEPSPLPAIMEAAADQTGRDTERPEESTAVAVLSARELHDGWSAHVAWNGFLGGVPPFDGELVLVGADPHRTWIALEGTVTLASHAAWSEAPLRLARLEIRRFLQRLAEVVSSTPPP